MGCCQSKESLNTKVEISEGGPDKTTILDAPKNPESGTEASQGSSAPPTVTVTVPDDFGKKALGVLRLADSVGSYVPESIGQYRVRRAGSTCQNTHRYIIIRVWAASS